jgi:hypothetical protein
VFLSHRLAVFLVAIIGLSLAATRGSAGAACPSTCTQELRECKRTFVSGGPARRDCRAACAERSTCTAPGARIRTLAYVVSECNTDPQGRGGSGLKQKLLIRRGNCDPVTVMEVAPSTYPVNNPLGVCRIWAGYRAGYGSQGTGVFQRMAVLPDGSGVVFEMTKQLSFVPALTFEPPEEGIFFVRADGRSPPRRVADASRFPTLFAVADPNSPVGVSFYASGNFFVVSPDGRKMAFIDFGPDTDGNEAPQIFLLDLRPPYRRTQLTHQSRVLRSAEADPGILGLGFQNSRTVTFQSTDGRAFQVKTDGKSPEKEIPRPHPTVASDARIVPQFNVTSANPKIVVIHFPDRLAVSGAKGVNEVFLIDGKNFVQLTNFGRSDTGGALIARDRVFLIASANSTGESGRDLPAVLRRQSRWRPAPAHPPPV